MVDRSGIFIFTSIGPPLMSEADEPGEGVGFFATKDAFGGSDRAMSPKRRARWHSAACGKLPDCVLSGDDAGREASPDPEGSMAANDEQRLSRYAHRRQRYIPRRRGLR